MIERDLFKDEERKIEKKVLFIYSLLLFAILVTAGNLRQLILRALIMLPGLSISWYLIHKQFRMNCKMLEDIETLRQTKQARDTLLTNISQEISTQLNTICNMNEVILGEKLTDTAKKSASVVQEAGRNLQTIVSNIMDFSELEMGRMTLNEECYNFSSIMSEVLDAASVQNAEKGLELIVDCDANIPSELMGDSQKISRIMTCLVDNAIRFTEEGCVRIRVSMRKEDYGGNLCISVSDTGVGMTLEQIEKFGADSALMGSETKSQNGGIGIGLAITWKLVTVMRGFISVKSELGQGSEVRVVLPQKVVDTKPIAVVKDKTNIRVICYIDQEKCSLNQIREYFVEAFENMGKQLEIPVAFCRDLSELKRKLERERYSHLFISMDEYGQEPEYFKALSEEMLVLLMADRKKEPEIEGRFSFIYKPFYIIPIVEALNGDYLGQRVYDRCCYFDRDLNIPEKPNIVREKLIDEKMGTEYCGGETEDYREVLKVYYDYGNTALKDMERFFEEKNWKEYTLLVHSLKSSSLGIGAETLFKLAKEQEKAVREEREAELLENHRPMMELYEKVLKEIADILQEE